jgi:hypothetical protein
MNQFPLTTLSADTFCFWYGYWYWTGPVARGVV